MFMTECTCCKSKQYATLFSNFLLNNNIYFVVFEIINFHKILEKLDKIYVSNLDM
jgi:hypothetical protein